MPGAFLYDNVVKGATLASAEASVATLPLSNLQDEQPRRRTRLMGSTATVAADLGSNKSIDCAALVSTTLGAGATVRARVGTEAALVEAAPIVDLDFLTRDALPQMAAWTPARGGGGGTGEATYFDAAGNLKIAAAGEYRITHDPVTLERKGVLLEPGRGNGIRNPCFVGAVPGTPGTAPTNYSLFQAGFSSLSSEVVAVGVENNMNYIDVRWYGTTNASGRLALFCEAVGLIIPATLGQTFIHSIYAKRIAGTYTPADSVFGVQENTGGASTNAIPLLAAAPPGNPSDRLSACRLVSVPHTVSTAPTNCIRPSWRSGTIGSGVAVDVTIRFAAPQTELGTFATMPMLPPAGTTGATTRAADTGSLAIAVPSSFSLYSEAQDAAFRSDSVVETASQVRVDNGSGNTVFQLRLYRSGTSNLRDGYVAESGSAIADFGNASIALSQITRQAAAYAANDMAYSANGAAIETDTSGVLPALTRFLISQGEAITYLRRLRLYDRRLTNAQLVALSGTGSSLVPAEVTGDTGTIAAEAEDANQGNVILTLAAPALGRFLRIDIDNPAAAYTDIGVLAAGALWRTIRSIAYGIEEGRLMLDRRDRNPFTGAEFPVPAIANPRYARFTLPVLSDAEVKASHRELVRLLGAAGDGLVIPDIADGLAERNRRALWGALNEPGGNSGTVMTAYNINERSFLVTERI
jgi:hypothetical protein